MTGNVYEWCSDWYGYYTSDAQINPTGPTFGRQRILRGTSFNYVERDYRSVFRGDYYDSGEVNTIKDLRLALSSDDMPGVPIEDIKDHEYVDLGLPSGTLWATCNVGANSPEEYGGYYAWGETEEKSEYSWKTYLTSQLIGTHTHVRLRQEQLLTETK